MDKQDKLLDKVSMKTNVSKSDILTLAQDLQTKDLNNEEDIREFVYHISSLTGKPVREAQVDKNVSVIKNNQVPTNIDKIV